MKSNQHLVSIIIVSWNGKHWLEKCLPTIQKQTYKNFEIIVADNGSTDGTVTWIHKKYPDIIIVPLGKNYGFAEGNNRAYKYAKGKYIYFLNNDTELAPTVLECLVQSLEEDPKTAGVQSKLLLMEKRDRLDTIGAFLTPTGFLYHNAFNHLDKADYNLNTELYTLKGASMFFRKNVLDQVLLSGNVFDIDYFAYFEETDLCHRIWLLGYKLRYAPSAVVWHHMGATSSSMDNTYVQFHSFKNRIATYLKNFEWITIGWLLPSHLLVCELFATITLIRGNLKLWASIQKAILWNIIHFSTILEKRKVIFLHMKQKNDKDLLPILLKNPPFRYYISWFLGRPYEEK